MSEKTVERIIRKDITENDGIINLKGSCTVKGNIDNAGLKATGNIIIEGNVINGKLYSSGGSVTIKKGIEGEKTVIESFGDIRAVYCHGGRLNSSNGSIYIKSRITNCELKAKNLVHMEKSSGTIECAKVQAGIEIIVNKLGNDEKDSTVAVLTNERQQEMFELMIVYEQKLKDKKDKLSKLEKIIKIIKLLGDKVVKLPQAKKEELAKKVKNYKELRSEINQIILEKNKVIKMNKEIKRYTRAIIVTGNVFPNVEIIIDKLKHQVVRSFKKVIFYKTGIIIMGDLDQFKLRQR